MRPHFASVVIRSVLIAAGILQFFVAYGMAVSPTQLWLAHPLPGFYILSAVGCLWIAAVPQKPNRASVIGTFMVVTALARSVISLMDGFHSSADHDDVILRAAVWALVSALTLGFWVTGVIPMTTLHWREKRRNGDG